MKINVKKILAALPQDCRRISRKSRTVWIEDGEVYLHPRIGAPCQRVRIPSVFPRDNPYREGAVLSDDPGRVAAWLRRGLE